MWAHMYIYLDLAWGSEVHVKCLPTFLPTLFLKSGFSLEFRIWLDTLVTELWNFVAVSLAVELQAPAVTSDF